MSDQLMTSISDTESLDLSSPPGSPLTKEKARAGQTKWIAELEEKPEFKILETLVGDPNTTPNDAVTQLVELTMKCTTEENPISYHCWITACALLEMAARTAPEHQAKLIAFLYLLRSITLKNPDSDELWEIVKGEGVVWKDLPTFGYTIADEMGSFDGQETEYTQEEAQKWENLTAFFAQIDASTSESPSPLNFTHSWALTALAWAFEGGGDSGEPSELAVRLACIWLVYDAQKLWSGTVDAQEEINSHERWNMWKQRLMDSRTRCINGTTPMLIDHALAQMQRASDAT